jgi:SAM-dependent methyltransferase
MAPIKFNIRERLFKIWYFYVNKVDKNAEVLFMNYGYSIDDQEITLDQKDEMDRYSIQLYAHFTSDISIKDKDIVEIGSGRGGGLNFLTKTFKPTSAIGIELDKRAITFCNKHYTQDNLNFIHGDAQKLTLTNESCDIILNVESSHRYLDMESFLEEVYRTLRSGGHFLFTDFRYDYEMDELNKQLELSGLKVVKERNINKEVITALELDDPRKRSLVKKLTPKFLNKIALNFSGTIGSETYNQFVSNKYIYFSYILTKLA